MSDSQPSKLFGDITGIVLKVVIGLVSFQLLAPYIWNYLSDLVHIQKIWTFRIITFIYFILPTILILVWWKESKANFIRLANPRRIDDKPADLKEKLSRLIPNFINAAQSTLIASLAANFILLFFPSAAEPVVLYIIYFLFLISVVIMVVTAYLVTEKHFRCFDDFSLELKKKTNRYKYFWVAFAAFFISLVILSICYLHSTDYLNRGSQSVCKANEVKSNAQINNAFKSVDLKSSISSARGHMLAKLQEVTAQDALFTLDTFRYSTKKHSYISFDTAICRTAHLPVDDTLMRGNPDSLRGDNFNEIRRRLIGFTNYMNRLADTLAADASAPVNLNRPPYEIDLLLGINLPLEKSDQNSVNYKKIWFEKAVEVMQNIEQKFDKSARKQIAIVLGNVQMKGIFLFFILMVFLSCLYVFLKTNNEILGIISQDAAVNADYNIVQNPGTVAVTSDMILHSDLKKQADEDLSINKGLLDSTWMWLTISFGLLIPLLKPVDENKINLDKPFQLLTIPGQIQSQGKAAIDDHSSHISVDSSRTYYFSINNKGDFTSHDPDSSGVDEQTKRMIKEINERVKQMSTKTDVKQLKDTIMKQLNQLPENPNYNKSKANTK